MAFQITGKIEHIGGITSIATKSGITIYRRELVLDATRYNPETGEPWENHPKFEMGGSNVNVLDQFQVGQKVTVDFSLRGAKYQDKQTGEMKYFTSINAFKVTLAVTHDREPFPSAIPSAASHANMAIAPSPNSPSAQSGVDDFPF